MEPAYFYSIRKLKFSEISKILTIERLCFSGPKAYTKRELEFLVKNPDSTCLVARDKKAIRGFIIVTYNNEQNCALIETLDVHPQYRNQGIGSALLHEMEKEMRERGITRTQLEVAERNENALWVYKKAGYEVAEKIEGYYNFELLGSRSAIRMVKALN